MNISVPEIPDQYPSIESPFKTRASYHVGFYGQIALGGKVYFQPELLYANKGLRHEDANIHLHYLTLPVLFNYRVLENIHAGLGGEIGYKLASRAKFEGGTNDVGWIFENNWDAGINAGVKYIINETLHAGIRYNYGLLDVFGGGHSIRDELGAPVELSKEPKCQHRVIQFSIGYTFI